MASPNITTPPSKWAAFGFTTTPEERIGPPPPYTSPALQANLFFRVFLGIISLFVTWVPARLLWRNGEFAGTVLCVMLLILNLMTVVNALLWRDDDVAEWWAGYGWCDIQTYTFFALHTAFNISLFEIMRGLASKVALNRAVKPTRTERRRQHLVSALIIFTVPVIQVILTYFTSIGRYNISTLVGCVAIYYPNWIYLVFYILPTPFFAVLASYAAGLTFYRYRKIDRVTRDISRSQDDIAAARQERVRKKLYFMTLVCIVVVLPLIMILLFKNIVEGAPWNLPYDFDALHYGPDPFNMYFISFTTSDLINFSSMNIVYIGEVAGIAVFIPFGTTPEALNMYRELLLAFGLGYVFPKLREEYVPRPTSGSWLSWGSLTRSLRGKSLLGTNSTTSTRKDSLLPTAEQISLASRADRARSPSLTRSQPKDLTAFSAIETVRYPEKTKAAEQNPWPDLSATELDMTTAQIAAGPPLAAARNPYSVLPSTHARAPPRFPSLSIPSHKKRQPQPIANHEGGTTSLSSSASSFPSGTQPPPQISPAQKVATANATAFDSAAALPTTTTSTTLTTAAATPWSPAYPSPFPFPNNNNNTNSGSNNNTSSHIGVDTRVWADDHPSSSSPSPASPAGTGTRKARTPPDLEPGRPGVVGQGQGQGQGQGVRVETSIARRSADLQNDAGGGDDASGEAEYRVRVGRASTTAAS